MIGEMRFGIAMNEEQWRMYERSMTSWQAQFNAGMEQLEREQSETEALLCKLVDRVSELRRRSSDV